MVSTFRKFTRVWDKSIDIFGEDIGVIVDRLFMLDTTQNADRIYFSNLEKVEFLSEIEAWILHNVGLPRWVSPNLYVRFSYDVKNQLFFLAEIEDNETVYVSKNGSVMWLVDGHEKKLNSSLLCFFRSLILLNSIIGQIRLVAGSGAYLEKNVPEHIIGSFKKSLECIDSGFSETWLDLSQIAQ
jgi:hypothetical protein